MSAPSAVTPSTRPPLVIVWPSDNEYDVTTWAVSQTVEDVDDTELTVPAGWSTPDGAGLHLVTDYQYDEHGRRTQTLGPVHDVDGQPARTASWTVYQDDDREVWNAQGYAVPLGSSSSSSSSSSGTAED